MPSKRNTQMKENLVDRMRDKPLIVTARFSNVNASQMDELRRHVTGGGGKVFVAKNTLVKIAASELGISDIDEIIDGPTAYIVAEDDIADMVKALNTTIRDQRIDVEILGGIMEQQLIDANRVKQIADLPSREQLMGMLASTLNGPLMSLTRVLNAPVQNLASMLEQIAQQRQSAESEAA